MKKTPVIHPFLFAIYPVLFLFANNMQHFPLRVVFIPALITTCFTLLCWFLLSLIFKDKKKAGLIVSLFLLLFFSYGHFYDAMKNTFFEWYIGRNLALLFIYGMLSLPVSYFSIKSRSKLHNLTNVLNVIAVSLVAISVFNIGAYKLKTWAGWQDSMETNIEPDTIGSKKAASLPNIYYIILDGYGRSDILKEIYHYDNVDLLDYLTRKGFYIADKSSANYPHTTFSLGASLNFNYIQNLFDRINVESSDFGPAIKKINNNMVVRFLKQHGYKVTVFSSVYFAAEINNADIYKRTGLPLNEFQQGLIQTTPIPNIPKILEDEYTRYRKRILYTFDHLGDKIKPGCPVFVFAHIMSTHPPFVFGPHGEEINPNRRFSMTDGSAFLLQKGATVKEYQKAYMNQAIFASNKIKAMVNSILSESARPPIIILQGDHGPGSMLDWADPDNTNLKERFSILNAYYFPDQNYSELYDDITPVNTFRIIFNHYFGTNYELLKDESYFSTWSKPYKFIDVTDEIKSDIDVETNVK